eukprot:4175945-Amphidinium_carterae.1
MHKLSLSSLFASIVAAIGTRGAEVAIIDIIRHGEKCPGCGIHLTKEGQARAEYIARCMRNNGSASLPFGPPDFIIYGESSSHRPLETVAPLARALGLEVSMPCQPDDGECFAKHVQTLLTNGSTLLVSWVHEHIPKLVKGLHVDHVPSFYDKWPEACPSKAWPEPACCMIALGSYKCHEQGMEGGIHHMAPGRLRWELYFSVQRRLDANQLTLPIRLPVFPMGRHCHLDLKLKRCGQQFHSRPKACARGKSCL